VQQQARCGAVALRHRAEAITPRPGRRGLAPGRRQRSGFLEAVVVKLRWLSNPASDQGQQTGAGAIRRGAVGNSSPAIRSRTEPAGRLGHQARASRKPAGLRQSGCSPHPHGEQPQQIGRSQSSIGHSVIGQWCQGGEAAVSAPDRPGRGSGCSTRPPPLLGSQGISDRR